MTRRTVYFDLEGPLSPQDNAYEVLSIGKNGRKVFEVISRYDDILTVQGREGYEPGDTLKLIVPFLLYYGIYEEDIEGVSRKAKITDGARVCVEALRRSGWMVRVISTSYQQHAHNIGRQLGIGVEDIACTSLPLTKYQELLGEEELSLLEDMESRIVEDFPHVSDEEIVKTLDKFFFQDLPRTRLRRVFDEVEVVGGQRKVRAVQEFSKRDGNSIPDSVAVGDSITDYKMLRYVRDEGGLAVAFNGNEYCIPYADVAVASTFLSDILPVVDAFMEGGKEAVRKEVLSSGRDERGIVWVHDADVGEIIKTHMEYRKKVRGEAGKLG